LQCVAVCCSVLQCVAVCCSVLQRVAVCCSVLQCVAVCCSVLSISLMSHVKHILTSRFIFFFVSHARLMYHEKRPMYYEKRPMYCETRPMYSSRFIFFFVSHAATVAVQPDLYPPPSAPDHPPLSLWCTYIPAAGEISKRSEL